MHMCMMLGDFSTISAMVHVHVSSLALNTTTTHFPHKHRYTQTFLSTVKSLCSERYANHFPVSARIFSRASCLSVCVCIFWFGFRLSAHLNPCRDL